MFHAKKTTILLLFITASVSVEACIGGRRRFECDSDEDCPAYHWCSYSNVLGDFTGSKCTSFMNDPVDTTKSCSASSDDCAAREAVRDPELDGDVRYATERCFALTGGANQCAKSYYMPCADDAECPDNFSCDWQNFSSGQLKVCKPNELPPSEYLPGACASNFDCGYDRAHGHFWTRCAFFGIEDEEEGEEEGRCAFIMD